MKGWTITDLQYILGCLLFIAGCIHISQGVLTFSSVRFRGFALYTLAAARLLLKSRAQWNALYKLLYVHVNQSFRFTYNNKPKTVTFSLYPFIRASAGTGGHWKIDGAACGPWASMTAAPFKQRQSLNVPPVASPCFPSLWQACLFSQPG